SQLRTGNSPRLCHQCGGNHWRSECPTSNRQPQQQVQEPSRQAHLAQELFNETDESEEEYEEAYPVQTRDKGKKKTPYNRPKKSTPEVIIPTKKSQEEIDEWNRNMDEMIKQANQKEDEEMTEKQRKPRTKKEYINLRERFLNSDAGLTQKKALELSMVYKKQVIDS